VTGAPAVDAAVAAALAASLSRDAGRIVVGYSGGHDSSVLLHAVARIAKDRNRLLALHVNHGLNPNADAWQRHCETVSAQIGISFVARRVVIAGARTEAAARRARYAAFRELLDEGDVLWLGHHLDDQAETMLWRLLRGGGAAALAGMPRSRRLGRGHLLRPVLEVPRADLAVWAAAHGISWIDDDSNADLGFARNYLRHEVLQVLQRRWPDVNARLQHAARRFSDEAQVIRSALDRRLDDVGAQRNTLPLLALEDRAPQPLLRRWLERAGIDGVRERVLTEIVRQANGAADRVPVVRVSAGYTVRRHGRALHLVADSARDFETQKWTLAETLPLPGGRLVARRGAGVGLRASIAVVEVRARRGGERLSPAGRQGTRSVKQLLREAGLPPWSRHGYPLIFVDGRLAGVPGVAVDATFAEHSTDAWHVAFDVCDA
jgi:tRNA(Ile)-lysidine synthase